MLRRFCSCAPLPCAPSTWERFPSEEGLGCTSLPFQSQTATSSSSNTDVYFSFSCLNAELLTRDLRPLYPIRNLLKRDLACKVRAPVLWLHINAKRTEPTVVRRAQLVRRDVLARLDQRLRNLLRRLD